MRYTCNITSNAKILFISTMNCSAHPALCNLLLQFAIQCRYIGKSEVVEITVPLLQRSIYWQITQLTRTAPKFLPSFPAQAWNFYIHIFHREGGAYSVAFRLSNILPGYVLSENVCFGEAWPESGLSVVNTRGGHGRIKYSPQEF